MIFLLISKVQLVSRLPPFANRSVLTDPPSVAAPASVRCAVKKNCNINRQLAKQNRSVPNFVQSNQSVRCVPNKIQQGHTLGGSKKGDTHHSKRGHTSFFNQGHTSLFQIDFHTLIVIIYHHECKRLTSSCISKKQWI